MKITITTECGEKTCAAKPGKFCRFVRTNYFGTKPICNLYGVYLWDEDGWLIRCEECLKENKGEKSHEGKERAMNEKEKDDITEAERDECIAWIKRFQADNARLQELLDSTMAQLHKTQEERDELQSDINLNFSMLAKQCNMAREAEARMMKAERDLERLWWIIIDGLMPRLRGYQVPIVISNSNEAISNRDILGLEAALGVAKRSLKT